MAVVAEESSFAAGESHRFYTIMAALCVAVAFAGFAPTYWLPMWQRTLNVPPLFHIHGAIFFAWTVLFLTQATLVASGRTARHRELGMAGIALATAIVFSGVLAALRSLNDGIALGFADQAREFAIVPLSSMVFFAVLVSYAVANVKRPDVHKRAMLLASISLLQAAVARWFLTLFADPGAIGPPAVVFTLPAAGVINLLLLGAIVHDWRTRGRPHRVYVVGGAALVLMQVLRVPVSTTPAWYAMADWFVHLTS